MTVAMLLLPPPAAAVAAAGVGGEPQYHHGACQMYCYSSYKCGDDDDNDPSLT